MFESAEPDHIGRIGEHEFHLLADKAKLLIGRIEPDRLGKDRVIEFALSARDENQPFDKRPPPLRCAVQIKSVKHTTERISISLSVAERLLGDPSPTFIAIMKIDDDDEVVEFRMLHLIDGAMEKILKRLRQEFAEKSETLNDHTISFAIKDAEQIDFKPSALKGYLQQEIGADIELYAREKAFKRKTLGFDPAKQLSGITTFSELDPKEFVNGLLGLRSLPVKSFELFEERFDIKLPMPTTIEEDIAWAEVEITPPSRAGTISFQSNRNAEQVELSCEIIAPVVDVPAKHFRLRAKTAFMNIGWIQSVVATLQSWRCSWDDLRDGCRS